jgi:hypothetical protein
VAVDPQVRRVPERIRAHPGHADQRLVRARVEPAVLHLDIVRPSCFLSVLIGGVTNAWLILVKGSE